MSGDVTNGKYVFVGTYESFATYGGPDFVRGHTQVLVLDGSASADGRMVIGAADDGTGEFGITIDTCAPDGTSTVEDQVPQSLGGGPLKLGAR